MDASEFTDTLRTERATKLDRLGSDKALVATTNAQLDTTPVLAAAARSEARAAETFEAWAADTDDEAVREAFEAVAETEREHYERVADRLDEEVDDDADPLHDHLRGLDAPVERVAAGMVARPLVASRSLLQAVNFFVNDADEPTANLFRDLRSETETMAEEGAELLETLCASEAEWDRAMDAATETVDVAYEAYADALEELGVDPRPVC
ncbi:ferritin family protein [Halomarina oriensis]|uniref:Rubrerythrin family protein n=1 Tax=Halomarina oriensis TaxID=671145 RepID=A0A6B0GLD0_9EURY|nr:ferritin family protein [Halomarina oriensis]MWG32915.1 rubrerythrin family protein [Halomarina oriensis]